MLFLVLLPLISSIQKSNHLGSAVQGQLILLQPTPENHLAELCIVVPSQTELPHLPALAVQVAGTLKNWRYCLQMYRLTLPLSALTCVVLVYVASAGKVSDPMVC